MLETLCIFNHMKFRPEFILQLYYVDFSIIFQRLIYNINLTNNFVFFSFEFDEENVHDSLINRQQNFNDEEIKM